MIIREWRACSSAEGAARYARHYEEHVMPEMRQVDGFHGSMLLAEDRGDEVDLVVMSYWRDISAIRGFAGENHEAAVVAPAAIAVLQEYNDFVRHYAVLSGAIL